MRKRVPDALPGRDIGRLQDGVCQRVLIGEALRGTSAACLSGSAGGAARDQSPGKGFSTLILGWFIFEGVSVQFILLVLSR